MPESTQVPQMVVVDHATTFDDIVTAEDFWAYSLARFARCTKLMATPEFMDVHVAAVLAG